MEMKVRAKAEVEAGGNSEEGIGIGKRATMPYDAPFSKPQWLLATAYSPFTTRTLNRNLYIPPFLLEKLRR
jgi:hypothetical protein